MRAIAKRLWYALWILNGYIGRQLSLDIPQRVTVLITYYSPARAKHIEPQVRNILKCGFVDKLVISSHNPEVHVNEMVRVRDERLIFMNQATKRGCGYRWSIAAELDPEYLIVVDDDLLLFPSQLAKLFKHLVSEPEAPHGFAGFLSLENDVFEYHQRENMVIDFLCEIYAVTRRQLKQYGKVEKLVAENANLSDRTMEYLADFMVISQTGTHKPRIHKVFRLFRSDTFRKVGIAMHKEEGWGECMLAVSRTLNNISVRDDGSPAGSVAA